MKKLSAMMVLALFLFSWMGCTAASSTLKTKLDDDAPFDRLDTDRSGWITQEEWDNFYPGNRTQVFYDLDSNHDSRISGDEWEAGKTSN